MSRRTCGSGLVSAILSSAWFFTHGLSAQNPTPNGPTDRFTEMHEYDPAVDFTTDTATFVIDGEDAITIQFVTGYPGTTPRPPKSVEVLIIRDLSRIPSSEPVNVSEQAVRLLVDAESFERRGTLNPRWMDRSQTKAFAMVFRADAFSYFAYASSVKGHAFDCDFALTPDQVVDLRSVVQRWMTSVP
jgi:hypothetical protein